MIKCIECNQASEIDAWNVNTKKHCGDEITLLNDVAGDNVEVFFYCPECNFDNYAKDLN